MGLTILAALVLLAVCAFLGAAAWRLAGLRPSPYLSPLPGLCLLMVVVQPALYLPGRGWTALGIVAVLLILAVSRREVRRDVAAALPEGAPLVLAALLLLCVPYFVSGRFGILGFGNNDDWVMHLDALRWLAFREIPETDTVAAMSYPLGPHAVGAAIATTGLTAVQALTAVMAMGPILSCLAALSALPPLRRSARWALALLAGLSYLGTAYYVQASHKEAMVMAPVLGFALVLPSIVRAAGEAATPNDAARATARAALVPALLVAGIVEIISAPGALWPLVTLVLWGVIWLAQRRLSLGSLRRAMPGRRVIVPVLAGLVATGVITLILLAPELTRIVHFQSTSFANERAGGTGNLDGPLPPWQGALGVWLNPDFRFATHLVPLTVVLILGAFALILVGAYHWLRRGPIVLAALFGADWIAWLNLEAFKNPYNAAKGLAMMSPLMGLALVTGATVAWSRRDRLRRPAAVAVRTTAVRAATVFVLAGAAVSTALALRDGVVGPQANAQQMQVLADVAGPNDRTALLDPSDFGSWYLFEQRPYRPPLLYPVHQLPLRPQKHWHAGHPLDFDTIAPAAINRFDWFVLPRTTFHSTPPAGVRIARQTAHWTLWHRVGTIPQRRTLDEGWQPGAVLDCSTRRGRRLSHARGTAIVRTAPVVVNAWRGTAEDAGSHASEQLRLPPGRWDLSLQYVSRNALTVTAPGMRPGRLPATLDRMAPFFSFGTVTSTGGPVTVRVDVDQLPWFGRLVGASGHTRGLNSPDLHALGAVAATRHGDRPRRVPLARACGRYVDSYTLG